jgi:hypothetical protein
MTTATALNLLPAVATLLLILSAVRIFRVLRGRAMRALAVKWNFQYVGPPAPPNWLWNPPNPKIDPPLPPWISRFSPGGRIRQVWNVIEGQQNGISVFIFDAVIGEYKGGKPCTVIACRTEQNPFRIVTSSDQVVQSHGWTVLYGVSFLWFSWIMSIKRIDVHLNKLR